MSSDLNRRQRARLSRDRWIAHHSAVQNDMQEHIFALQRQVAELNSDVIRKDSEIQRLVDTARDRAGVTDNIHNHDKTSTTDILEGKESVMKNAETQTTDRAAHAHTQTEAKLSQHDSAVQTGKDPQCSIGTQTLEGMHVDGTNKEDRSALERVSRELAQAKGQIKQMGEWRENTFAYAKSLVKTAEQNHKEMIDDLKSEHKQKENEFRKEVDRMRSEYEARIRDKELLLLNPALGHHNEPEAPRSREPEAQPSTEREAQPSTEQEDQPRREGEARRESSPAPKLLGNAIRLGSVSCCTIEQEGQRGILLTNTSQFNKKSVAITFAGSNKNYEVILEPKQSRVFQLSAVFHSMKEAYLTSEIGEPKVLPFLWRSLPRVEDHMRSSATSQTKSSTKPDQPAKKKAKMTTPVRQSRRLQNH